MKDQNKVLASSLAALALFLSATATAESYFADIAPQSSVRVCIDQIADHANFAGASRVLHEVESTKRRSYGHLLEVDTKVFGDIDGEVIRAYAATCVVTRSGAPRHFQITETDLES